ncbi:N-methyl-L-tryptophan oxidase [Planomicrobium sp. CPCC 101110]|uniref:N-methyl-L-tryptophan oxidase n=1 Tax=Planomicrobium sp. CPCC 101110 TaxID=2599619 RepID=UPI0011B60918|nr:N-methyl-L-tryptophan oxidase [Planomicrobium sp. CPCC 101110]TWT25779.1 N-methyl-L-tryptophan oxidase [Planomicrobium sp. CPCC 101110]
MWDVGIIGIGTMGSMAAWQLSSKGKSVIGFEQFGIGHDRSAAGGESRLFRTAYKEGPEYVPILKRSQELWRQLEKETSSYLLHLNGGLTIGQPEEETVKNSLKAVTDFSIEHEILDYVSASKRYPQHRLSKDEIMVLDKEAGYIRPELAVVTAATRAEDLGAEILRYTTVEKIEPKNDHVAVTAKGQTYKVRKLLITAGPWAKNFLPAFQPYLPVKRIFLTWFPAKDIELFGPKNFPVFTRRTEGYRFFGAPTLEGSMIKIGTSKPGSEVASPDQLAPISLEELADSSVIVQKYFRGVRADPVRADVYMDAFTPDNQSIVGKVPDMPNTYTLSGFSGHGFKMAPAFGELAANLIMEKQSDFQTETLNPERYIQSIKTI